LELNFKGGQVGAENYFEAALQGTMDIKNKTTLKP